MASWDNNTASPAAAPTSAPQVKFENSPAESFMSAPGDDLYPLFTPSADDAMNPMEAMTPESVADTRDDSPADDASSSPAAESTDKKPTKKRKSWGQVLPEPKTNLPPRKRAKTEDEKEQRRVERVLRNRRAAQSSRERKRQEVEALEKRNKDLEDQLLLQKKQNEMLMDELNRFKNGSSPIAHPSPLTLSQPLFGGAADEDSKVGVMSEFSFMSNNGTVDPASISPALSPVADDTEPTSPAPEAAVEPSTTDCTSTDVTQHPAVSVGAGAAVVDGVSTDVASSAGLVPAAESAFGGLFGDALDLPSAFDADSWGVEAQFSPSSDPLNFEYHHMDDHAPTGLSDFDFSQFLSDDVSGPQGATAGHLSSIQDPESSFLLADPENQVSSEAYNQQPHLGASSFGCDDGVIAVGN